MAQSNAERLVNLGLPAELAKVMQEMILASVAAKPEVAALDAESTAAEIVAALQA